MKFISSITLALAILIVGEKQFLILLEDRTINEKWVQEDESRVGVKPYSILSIFLIAVNLELRTRLCDSINLIDYVIVLLYIVSILNAYFVSKSRKGERSS